MVTPEIGKLNFSTFFALKPTVNRANVVINFVDPLKTWKTQLFNAFALKLTADRAGVVTSPNDYRTLGSNVVDVDVDVVPLRSQSHIGEPGLDCALVHVSQPLLGSVAHFV